MGLSILAFVAGLVGGGAALLVVLRLGNHSVLKGAEIESRNIRELAQAEAEKLKKEAVLAGKEEVHKDRRNLDNDKKEWRLEVQKTERRLEKKEENIDRKLSSLDEKEIQLQGHIENIAKKEKAVEEGEERLQAIIKEEQAKLEQVAGITRDEAKRELLDSLETEAKKDGAHLVKRLLDEARENADMRARDIIVTAIQRLASEQVVQATVSVVDIPSDDMKGRIIGREGRNIRALEVATGIDLIIDDTPGVIILSGFDGVRREIAGETLKRLMQDGRIHPARIEETVNKVKKEMSKKLREWGKEAAFEVGLHGLHDEIIHLMGRLRFRTSYAQNVLAHSKEVSFICGMIAEELGANAKVARRAGFLHDIGKAIDHEVEGGHAVIGAEFCRKYGESKAICHAIEAHHYDVEPSSVEAIIVLVADALSAARPGARREAMQSYVKRLEDLESLANTFQGVERSFALQAGREVRVIVEPGTITDSEMTVLARDMAKKIEETMQYPGEIKVTVIRETRSVEFAR